MIFHIISAYYQYIGIYVNAWYQYFSINSCYEEPTYGYHNCNTSQILLLGRYLKV